MFDHISLPVTDFDKACGFYAAALAPLGIAWLMTFPGDKHDSAAGFGVDGKPFFWVGEAAATVSVHVAFAAAQRGMVDAFHHAALSAGGTDNGAPGIREQYHPNYYAAFVLDPDGHNIEAVCHLPQ